MGRDDTKFVDMFIWLIDVGMRIKTELLKFKVTDVNFKDGTVYFYRPKTKSYSTVPLTDRCLEIAHKLKIDAMEITDRKMFGHITHR